MFRSGRSNRPEQADNEPTPRAPQPAPPPNDYAPAPPPPPTLAAPTPAAQPTTPPRAVSETESLARDIKDGSVGGFVGVHSALTGEANFRGMLRVDGRVSGRVTSQDGTLIVSAGGQVDADIEVAVAKINGTVNGDIRARDRIEFGRTARVTGNIQTPALVIEQGAIFEGGCRMSAAAAKPAPAEKPAAAASTAAGGNGATKPAKPAPPAAPQPAAPRPAAPPAAVTPAAPAPAEAAVKTEREGARL
ncbi:MAG TPA: polymer-forming cytoskeletal protein [Pyrinomonadaceae bacterium]|jgi:cytoskeletal protein CcmA (bactofilin family)